jgi:hypothetical protein
MVKQGRFFGIVTGGPPRQDKRTGIFLPQNTRNITKNQEKKTAKSKKSKKSKEKL